MRKKNKKRIDPRYFLHETVLREQADSIVVALGQVASAVNCENPELGERFTNQLRTLRNALPDFNTPIGKHLFGQVNALEQHKPGDDFGPMHDARIALENYFSKTLEGEWDANRYKELSKCAKEPVHPMTGPDTSSTRWG
tara:strand:+ start:284 stop:703 length:420 start_codon:yes stop_codon:yes gene_type:complete